MPDRLTELGGSVSTSTTRRRRVGIAAIVAGAACIAAGSGSFHAAPSIAQEEPVGAILVSWDGARLDTLRELLHWQPLSETPQVCPGDEETLPKMPVECGGWWSCLPAICQYEIIESHVTTGKSLTRVQHASMLTGLPPEVSRVETNNGSGSVPYNSTIYERLWVFAGSDTVFAHVGSHRYTIRGILNWVHGTLIPEENIGTRGRPDRNTGKGSNENFLPMLQKFEGKRFFAFEHQKGIDMAGHGIGDRSIQYKIAMIAADERLKELQDELERLGMAERTHIFVTTDHGFWHNTHLGSIRPSIGRTWIASQKDKLLCHTRANVIDVVPTILSVFGVDPSRGNPKLTGRSLLDNEREGDCVMPVCGDGVIEVGEDCEPSLPLADTCVDLGYLRGDIGCRADCTYNTSDCADVLAITKLSINPSKEGGVDIQVKMADRDRGGPNFDPAADAVGIDVLNGSEVLWTGATENYDPSWRKAGETNSWQAARGTREDGLIAVNMSAPLRRMKMQINAGSVVGIADFVDATALRTVIHVGQERFDANLICHKSHDLLGLRCSYERPVSELRERRQERDREAPK